jgi:hypothetical protein
VALTAGFLKRPPAAFELAVHQAATFFRDPDGKPDLKVCRRASTR